MDYKLAGFELHWCRGNFNISALDTFYAVTEVEYHYKTQKFKKRHKDRKLVARVQISDDLFDPSCDPIAVTEKLFNTKIGAVRLCLFHDKKWLAMPIWHAIV